MRRRTNRAIEAPSPVWRPQASALLRIQTRAQVPSARGGCGLERSCSHRFRNVRAAEGRREEPGQERVTRTVGVHDFRRCGVDVMPTLSIHCQRSVCALGADDEPLALGREPAHERPRIAHGVVAEEDLISGVEERLMEGRRPVVVVQVGPDRGIPRPGGGDRVEGSRREIKDEVARPLDRRLRFEGSGVAGACGSER
jgi:hypothetical protein